MNVALSVWQDRVSPVFDASQSLLLIKTGEAGRENDRNIKAIEAQNPLQRVRQLINMEADVLICGAISSPLAAMVVNAGIKLVPFVTGEAEPVLAAFFRGQLPSPGYMLPGCGGKLRHRFRGGRPS